MAVVDARHNAAAKSKVFLILSCFYVNNILSFAKVHIYSDNNNKKVIKNKFFFDFSNKYTIILPICG